MGFWYGYNFFELVSELGGDFYCFKATQNGAHDKLVEECKLRAGEEKNH